MIPGYPNAPSFGQPKLNLMPPLAAKAPTAAPPPTQARADAEGSNDSYDASGRSRCAIIGKTPLSHDVDRWRCIKPEGFSYTPGQAVELAVDRDGLRGEPRPFTMTNLPDSPWLEFVIKRYPSHDGVTDTLADVTTEDHFLVGEPFGELTYQGSGTFIAGGAGLTPFLAILRQCEANHDLAGQRLIFSNHTPNDIILRQELDRLLPGRVVYLVNEDPADFTERGIVDRSTLARHCSGFADQYFYLCGPPGMGESVKADLLALGANEGKIVHADWDG